MKDANLRLNKILIWQALNAQNHMEASKVHMASAFHDVRNLVNHIEKPPQNLIFLLNEILNRTKFEKTGVKSHKQNFSISEMLRDIEEIFASSISRKGLTWISDYNFKEDLFIFSDQLKLMQILTNLVGNSCKFTEKGFIKIIVRLNDSSDKIYFAIEDSGIGIGENSLQHLFEEFVQIQNASSYNDISGTGLGIPICKGFVNSLGGNLEVVSTLGKGTKFFFEIPCQASIATSTFEAPPDMKRVLIIDDDLPICELINRYFEKRNIPCDFTHLCNAAIKLCASLPVNHYSLIITDMNLNGSDGISCAKVIKNHLNIPCPIILLSASEEIPPKDLFCGFLKKPVSVRDLGKIGEQYLGLPAISYVFKHEFADDTNTALKNVLSKHRIKFKENYKESADKVKSFLTSEDFEGLRNYSHSLKGLASTLGYKEIADYSGDIESMALDIISGRIEPNQLSKKVISLAIENYRKALTQIYFL